MLHPTCALWGVDALGKLPVHLATGRRSLAGFAQAAGFVQVEWPEGPFFNVNTAEDLAEAELRLRSEVQHGDQGSGR